MPKQVQNKDAKCKSLAFEAPLEILKKADVSSDDFQIEAYTGAVVERWWGSLAIDVDGIRAKANIPILRQHNALKIVGFSTKTWADKSFFVAGRFSDATSDAEEVRGLATEGFPWQASIGVAPKKVLSIENGETHSVNGVVVDGPAEIWVESEVYETSFVPLGADGDTSVSMLSRFEEIEQPNKSGEPEEGEKMEITIEILEEKAPDLLAKIRDEALKDGINKGRKMELERVAAVQALSMPGHEGLINQLSLDGETTAELAALAVMRAEKQIRVTAAQNLADDTIEPVAPAPAPVAKANTKPPKDGTLQERADWEWDNKPETRAEFRDDKDVFMAAFKAYDKGLVRSLGGDR